MEGAALTCVPLLPPLAPPPAAHDLVCLSTPPATRLACRHGPPGAPALPPSARAGGGSGDGGAGSGGLLLPSRRPAAGEPQAAPPPPPGVCGVTVEAATASTTTRTRAGPGPHAAWVAAAAPWLALSRSPGTVQVVNAATGRLFLHAPAPTVRRRVGAGPATILGGFWVACSAAPPRLALVTTDGLDVAALSARGDGTVPARAAPAALPGTAWFAWNAGARVCLLGTGGGGERGGKSRGSSDGGGGAAPPSPSSSSSMTPWAVAFKFAGDGSLARLPPCAPPELSAAADRAVLASGDRIFLVVAPSPAAPAAVLECTPDAMRRVGSLPPPPGRASSSPPLFTAVDGLLIRLAPGCHSAVVLEVGRPAVAVAVACMPPGWDDDGGGEQGHHPSPRWSLTPSGGVLLDTATGAAWSLQVDPAAAAAALGGGSLAEAAAFHARRQSGSGGDPASSAASTITAFRALLRDPASTASEVRAVVGVLARATPGGGVGPSAVAGLLSGEVEAGPARLTAAAAAYVAALHAAGVAWDSLDPAAATALDALTAGGPPARGRAPLRAAARAAGVLPPPTTAALIAAALRDRAPLRALRAAAAGGGALDAATAGAIASVAVEVGLDGGGGGDAFARAAGAVMVDAVQAACGRR